MTSNDTTIALIADTTTFYTSALISIKCIKPMRHSKMGFKQTLPTFAELFCHICLLHSKFVFVCFAENM